MRAACAISAVGLLLMGCGVEVTVGREPEPAANGFVEAAPYECGPLSLAQMGLDVAMCEGEPRLTLLEAGWSWEGARDENAMRLVVTGEDELRLPRIAADGVVDDTISFSYGEDAGYRQARGVGVDASGRIWSALMFDADASLGDETLEPLGKPLTLALARSTPSGALLGVETVGITNNANHVGMLPVDDGMIVAGLFESSLALGPTEASGSWDAFVAAFDGTGGLRWFHAIGTPLGDFAVSMATGPDGVIYVVGAYAHPIGDVNTPEMHAAAGGLLARLSPTGELLGVGKVDDPRIETIHDIAALADGTLIVVGSTKPPLDYNPQGVFAARLDGDADVLWFRELGGENGGYASAEVEVLADGKIVIATTLGTDPCVLVDEEFSDGPIEPNSQPVLVVLDQDGTASCATEWGHFAAISALVAFEADFAISGRLYGPTFGDEERSNQRRPFVARFE